METFTTSDVEAIRAQLAQMMELLAKVLQAPPPAPARSSYSPEEVAAILSRSRYTVREWCREGQCHAYKVVGWKSGPHDRWRITAAEVERIRSAGLLPVDAARNRGRTDRV